MDNQRVVLITGTSGGLGNHLAQYYAGLGDQVVGCSRRELEDAENYRHFKVDITSEKDVRGMFAEVRRDYGRLDVLINNAGLFSNQQAIMANWAEIRQLINTNLLGSITCSREAAKIMTRTGGGRILSISSAAVPLGTVGNSIYSSSKAGIEQFTRVFAKEVSSFGITANVLSLTIVEGPGMAENLSDEAISEVLSRTATGKQLTATEITDVMDFLISDASSALTGNTIHLGGA